MVTLAVALWPGKNGPRPARKEPQSLLTSFEADAPEADRQEEAVPPVGDVLTPRVIVPEAMLLPRFVVFELRLAQVPAVATDPVAPTTTRLIRIRLTSRNGERRRPLQSFRITG
jgi:hypothetical protein